MDVECYKVLTTRFNKLWSYNTNGVSDESRFLLTNSSVVEYKKNEIIFPHIPESYLFVFDTKQHANILYMSDITSIYKCLTNELIPPITDLISAFAYSEYWKNPIKYIKQYTNKNLLVVLPEGTMFCSSLKLIEKIK